MPVPEFGKTEWICLFIRKLPTLPSDGNRLTKMVVMKFAPQISKGCAYTVTVRSLSEEIGSLIVGRTIQNILIQPR